MQTFNQFFEEAINGKPLEHGCFGKDGVPIAVVHWNRTTKLDEFFGLLKKKKTEFFTKHDNNHLGANVKEVHKKLQAAVADRSAKHLDTVKKYTQSSIDVNTALYRNHQSGHEPPKEVHFMAPEGGKSKKLVSKTHTVAHIDAAIDAHRLPVKLHVYTGVGFHPGALAAQHPEHHIHLPAFTSTSIDKQVAANFAKGSASEYKRTDHAHMLHIELPKDHPATYLGDHSHYDHEKEVLLGRNTRLKIHPEPEVHIDDYGKKIHVWKAKPVDHEANSL